MKKFSFKHKNKKINVNVEECRGLKRAFGLMFGRRERAKALLFNFEKPTSVSIHSLFVFFPFVAVWLDGNNNAVDIREIKSFTLAVQSRKKFRKLIEIPKNRCYFSQIKSLKSINSNHRREIRKI